MLGAILIAIVTTCFIIYYNAYRYVHKYRKVFKEMGLPELPQKGLEVGHCGWRKVKTCLNLN